MNQDKRFRIIIIAGILGVSYTIFLLYKRREGHLIINDLYSIVFVSLLVIVTTIYYFRNKSKDKE